MGVIASHITSLTIVYSAVYSDADQRKHQSSASLAFVRGIHRGPVNSPHKWPVTRKMFPFDDVIMFLHLNLGVTKTMKPKYTSYFGCILNPYIKLFNWNTIDGSFPLSFSWHFMGAMYINWNGNVVILKIFFINDFTDSYINYDFRYWQWNEYSFQWMLILLIKIRADLILLTKMKAKLTQWRQLCNFDSCTICSIYIETKLYSNKIRIPKNKNTAPSNIHLYCTHLLSYHD